LIQPLDFGLSLKTSDIISNIACHADALENDVLCVLTCWIISRVMLPGEDTSAGETDNKLIIWLNNWQSS